MRIDRQRFFGLKFLGLPPVLAERRHRVQRMLIAATLSSATVVVVAATIMTNLL